MTETIEEIGAGQLWRRGTVRACPPEHTWARVQPLLREAGVTRVADITRLDAVGIPVHSAMRPASRTLAVSQGKGLTAVLSAVSAVMEAIELWFAERPREPEVRATPLAALRDEVDYRLDQLDLVTPSLLTDAYPLDWLAGRGLLTGRAALLPSEYVLLDRTVREHWQPPLFAVTSNGLASGNTGEEAALHALCEIVERDCLARASADLTRRPIPLTGLGDPAVAELAGKLEASANELALYDITGPLGVPCVAATVRDATVPVTFGGFGCHPDVLVATARAITEAVQQRLATIAGTRDDLPFDLYPKIRAASPQPPRTRPGTWYEPPASLPVPDFASALAEIGGRVRDTTGHEPIVVTLTGAADPIAVVKVVAPGLRLHTGRDLATAGGAR
ncbi:YcaO-like family protein [Amycolatopsis magusensis]|uniref:YcaO-like family protein n=1 Tax=Amycolatopsis magusensis TaxID=882444 RepID=UPI003C2B8178